MTLDQSVALRVALKMIPRFDERNVGFGGQPAGNAMAAPHPHAGSEAREGDVGERSTGSLGESGVQKYSCEECWEDYRISSLFCWLYTVIALGTLDVANERGLALFTANIERNSAALLDLNASELLPS